MAGIAAFPHTSPAFCSSCPSNLTSACSRAATGHSMSISGRGLGNSQERARSKRWECRVRVRCPQPSSVCWEQRSRRDGSFSPLQAASLGLGCSRQGALAGARTFCRGGRVFQQGGVGPTSFSETQKACWAPKEVGMCWASVIQN